jgi:hypothetical protein
MWGMGVCIHIFMTTALVEGEWPASYPDYFTSGPQNLSEQRGEEKIVKPARTKTQTLSVAQPVASRYIDCTILPPYHMYYLE